MKPIELQFACQYVVPSPTEIDHSAFLRLNDLSIADYLREDIGTAHDRGELSPGPRVWEPTDILRPMYIRDESGVKLEVEKMQVSYQIEAKYKFGYLQDFDTVLFLNEEIERSEAALLLPADELTFDPSRFATFDSEREFPVEPKLAISVLEVPETEPKIADVEVIRVS